MIRVLSLCLLVLVACAPSITVPETSVAPVRDNSPQVRVAEVPNETSVVPAIKPAVVSQKQVIEFANYTTYWFWDDDKRLGAAVDGDQRRIIITYYKGDQISGWGPGDLYWNESTQNAILFAGYMISNCTVPPGNLNSYLPFYYIGKMPAEYRPKGPLDWANEFRNRVPLETRNTSESIKSAFGGIISVDKIHTFGVGGTGTVTLRVNSKLGIPLQIDVTRPPNLPQRYKLMFDTRSHNSFNRVPISETVHPRNMTIVSETEYQRIRMENNCYRNQTGQSLPSSARSTRQLFG